MTSVPAVQHGAGPAAGRPGRASKGAKPADGFAAVLAALVPAPTGGGRPDAKVAAGHGHEPPSSAHAAEAKGAHATERRGAPGPATGAGSADVAAAALAAHRGDQPGHAGGGRPSTATASRPEGTPTHAAGHPENATLATTQPLEATAVARRPTRVAGARAPRSPGAEASGAHVHSATDATVPATLGPLATKGATLASPAPTATNRRASSTAPSQQPAGASTADAGRTRQVAAAAEDAKNGAAPSTGPTPSASHEVRAAPLTSSSNRTERGSAHPGQTSAGLGPATTEVASTTASPHPRASQRKAGAPGRPDTAPARRAATPGRGDAASSTASPASPASLAALVAAAPSPAGSPPASASVRPPGDAAGLTVSRAAPSSHRPVAPDSGGPGSPVSTPGADHSPVGLAPLDAAVATTHTPAPSPVATVSPAVAAPPAASPAALPGVASQLLSVLGPLRQSATGTQSLTVLLHPEQLGDVRATVSTGNGQLLVRLAASTPDGASALRTALPSLQLGLAGGTHHAMVVLADAGGERRSTADTGGQPGGRPAVTARPESPSAVTSSAPAPVRSTTSDRLLDVRL